MQQKTVVFITVCSTFVWHNQESAEMVSPRMKTSHLAPDFVIVVIDASGYIVQRYGHKIKYLTNKVFATKSFFESQDTLL